jgi:hypothetical protein
MKYFVSSGFVLFVILLLSSCAKSSEHKEHEDDMTKDDPNQALYDQVMAVHNEVMPKTGEIYQLKKELKDKILVEPGRSKDFEQAIAELDSADHSMMDWMHKFNEPDSVTQEVAREYLENEMVKINQVKELINTSIQKAKDQLGKK